MVSVFRLVSSRCKLYPAGGLTSTVHWEEKTIMFRGGAGVIGLSFDL